MAEVAERDRDIGVVPIGAQPMVHLLAGQMCFGAGKARVCTLLGSCVGVTLWHPARRIGGMCHFLLPRRARPGAGPRDARYGDEALSLLVEALRRAGTQPGDYEAHLYGGADTMPDSAGVKFNVGQRNIEQGWALIADNGFSLQSVDVGDVVPRTVSLDLGTGAVTMRRGNSMRSTP